MISDWKIKEIYVENVNGEKIKFEPVTLEPPGPVFMGIDAASMEGWAELAVYLRREFKEEDINASNNS